MAMTSTEEEVGDRLLLSSLLSSGICTQTTHAAAARKARRRRRKARKEGEEAKKRRLSEEQVQFLEMSFGKERKLESGRKLMLASEAGLDPKQVAVWFQNRRARWKSKRVEEEYLKLKSAHEAAIAEKSYLEAEVLKLKEQLSEIHKEISKLSSTGSERAGEISSSSPANSFSVEYFADEQPPPLGFVGPAAVDELMYPNLEFQYYANMLDWGNLFGMI